MFVCVFVGEISSYRDEIETELENSRPKLKGIYAAYTREGISHESICAGMFVCVLVLFYVQYVLTYAYITLYNVPL